VGTAGRIDLFKLETGATSPLATRPWVPLANSNINNKAALIADQQPENPSSDNGFQNEIPKQMLDDLKECIR
jgi:hypothetical protein